MAQSSQQIPHTQQQFCTFCCKLLSRISNTGTIMTGKVNSSPRHSASFTATVVQSCGRFKVMMSLVSSPKAAYPICNSTPESVSQQAFSALVVHARVKTGGCEALDARSSICQERQRQHQQQHLSVFHCCTHRAL